MTQVYRMENSKGNGPFNMADPDFDYPGMAKAVGWLKPYGGGVGAKNIHESETHPHHMQDIPGTDLGGDEMGIITYLTGSPWKIGVKDQQQFYHWFPHSSLHWFGQHGYKEVVYDVPPQSVKWGKYQVMFNRLQAHKVKEIQL
jgi:hypothetical protein